MLLKKGAKYTARAKEILRFDSFDEENRAVQGGYADKDSYVIAFFKSDAPTSRIRLVRLGLNGEILKASEPLDLDHANNVTYIPKKNKFLVSHCQSAEGDRYAWYSLVDADSFEVTETGELEKPFFSMGYCPERDRYASGEWGGEWVDVWEEKDGKITLSKHFSEDRPGSLSQGVWAGEDYIWFIRSSTPASGAEILLYDWETGELCFRIPMEGMNKVEPENITVRGDEITVIGNKEVWGTGGIVYKVELIEG